MVDFCETDDELEIKKLGLYGLLRTREDIRKSVLKEREKRRVLAGHRLKLFKINQFIGCCMGLGLLAQANPFGVVILGLAGFAFWAELSERVKTVSKGYKFFNP